MRFLILLSLFLQIPLPFTATPTPNRLDQALTITPSLIRPIATREPAPELENEPNFQGPKLKEGGSLLPIPTIDTEIVADTTLSLYNVLNTNNILLIIIGILLACLVLAWIIHTVRNPPDYG